MGVQCTITFLLLYCNIFIHGDEVSNLRTSTRSPDKTDPVTRKEQAIPQVESNFEASNGSPGFIEKSPSTNNVFKQETRLLIQWKQAVVDNSALMDSHTTQILQAPESISFSQLLESKHELLNGNVRTLKASSRNSKNDEGVKVMLESPQFGITAVAGPQEALERYDLNNHPAVERVEIDMKLKTQGFVVNRPTDMVNEIGSNNRRKRTSPSATHNIQSTDSVPYGITMIQADQIEHHPTNKMRACVVDTGMDINHQDLPKLHHGLGGWNHATAYGDQKWYIDGHGHGTHVSGTIAAIKNDVGLLGVEDDPSRSTLSIGKGLTNAGWGYNSVILDSVLVCVHYHQAKVVNLSLGSSAYSAIAEDFYKRMYDQGALIVAAAGNSANTVLNYPAAYPSVMSVVATSQNRGHAAFNTRNSQVEIAAPGVEISSTFPNNRYVKMSGTSMASPHVAGVALKVWSWFPECSNTQIRNVLLKSASTVGGNCNIYFGYGIIQASDALQMLQTYGCEAGGITPEPRHILSPGGCQQLSYMQTRPPTAAPTNAPTAAPTNAPTAAPNSAVSETLKPTDLPTKTPTKRPTDEPTLRPTKRPTDEPTLGLTRKPTDEPTLRPTKRPTDEPTLRPTKRPTDLPTKFPTRRQSSAVTASPTTASPTTASPTTASPTTASPTTASPTRRGITGFLRAGQLYHSRNWAYVLVFQGDGNLVVYGTNGPVWATNTHGWGFSCVMQGDGNLVIYGYGSAQWNSGTYSPGSYLDLLDNGALVIFDTNGLLVKVL